MSQEHEEEASSESLGDPDGTRLLCKCLDELDGVLFENGLEFNDEEHTWEQFGEELRGLLYKYYTDCTGGDSEFDPKAKNVESEESLIDDDEPEEEEEPESSDSPQKNKKSKK